MVVSNTLICRFMPARQVKIGKICHFYLLCGLSRELHQCLCDAVDKEWRTNMGYYVQVFVKSQMYGHDAG